MIALSFLSHASQAPLIFAADSPFDTLNDTLTKTGFSWPHFISQVIAFCLVAFLLNLFAYKPVRNILEQRRNTIIDSMSNAERIKKELLEAEASRLAIIQKANEQANAIIADAEKAAAHRTEQRTQEATRQAEDIVKKAHEASTLERDRLLADLKRQVGALVIQTTEKVAGKVLSSEDQTRLNAETLSQLSASNN